MVPETIDDEWDALLTHRPPADRPALIARFHNSGVQPAELRRTLADLGDSLFIENVSGAEQAPTERRLTKESVLLAELGAYLRHVSERAAWMRSNNLRDLLVHTSLAQIAMTLGVSRQAIHKSATAPRMNPSYARTVSHMTEAEQ